MARVIGGYFASLILPESCRVQAWVDRLGPFESVTDAERSDYGLLGVSDHDVEAFLNRLKIQGESIGAQLVCRIENPPMGLGEPVFSKLKSDLASAVMSVGAVTAFGYGLGFEFGTSLGSEVTSKAAGFGGIEGGISTGDTIEFRCSVRPPSTVGEKAKMGRHDPCIAPRIVPVIEAMTQLVLADHLLRQTAIDAFQPRPMQVPS